VVNNQYFSKEMIDNVSQILILLIGIMLVNNGTMSLGFLITYTVLANLFLEPIKNIIDLDFEIKGARSALDRVKDLFINPQRKKSKHTKGHIEFKDVVYSFDDINLVLKGINLKIKEKNKVLITGKSGSGKSTLLKLLKGYFENYQGEILINGKNLNEGSLKINYINQKEILFTGTVNDNLCLKGSKKLNKIKRVCHTDEIVHNNDLSYNMLLEEDGFNISGGQRQRIVLARSLQNFDILIIDEGLNQLDVNLERQILKKLFKKYINKTIIVISHRLDNLDLYDQYIKLEEGKITLNEERSD
jgi:ABC-type bacteriocin/lantibiotic exporter with double-glycine peptidase domain